MSQSRRTGALGFTLIEVLVAIVVVALGIGALLTTLASAADTISRLREKSFAEWIALNQIATLRLSGSQAATGVTRGTVDYAGTRWQWEQEVTDPGVAGILRVDVRVAPQTAKSEDSKVSLGDTPMASVGTAYGFLSSAVERPNGATPDWSFAAAAPRGGGRTGGTVLPVVQPQ